MDNPFKIELRKQTSIVEKVNPGTGLTGEQYQRLRESAQRIRKKISETKKVDMNEVEKLCDIILEWQNEYYPARD